MLASIRAFAASGKPVVAECGGLMYLGATLSTDDQVYPMCGVIPYHTRMAGRLTLGYRDLEVLEDTPVAMRGEQLRAHEFHHSTLVGEATFPAYRANGQLEGYARRNVLASYMHLHLGADVRLAEHFVARCQALVLSQTHFT